MIASYSYTTLKDKQSFVEVQRMWLIIEPPPKKKEYEKKFGVPLSYIALSPSFPSSTSM